MVANIVVNRILVKNALMDLNLMIIGYVNPSVKKDSIMMRVNVILVMKIVIYVRVKIIAKDV